MCPSSFKAHLNSAIPEDTDKQSARLLKILQSWEAARHIETIRKSFQQAGFAYEVVDGSLHVSFLQASAVIPDATYVPPAPEPSGRRIPIAN